MKYFRRLLLAFILYSTVLSAGIINVPADIDSIQGGINLANPGDTVLVQPGTYHENINFNGKNIIVGSLTLITGETSFISQTIIDGDTLYTPVVSIISGEDSTAELTGFTVKGGEYNSGLITIEDSDPRCSNLIVGPSSTIFLSGISCNNSNSKFNNVNIHHIRRTGAPFKPRPTFKIEDSDLTIKNCQISNNFQGIFCDNSNLTIFNSEIFENGGSWEGEGGGIYCDSSNLVLNNVIIRENLAQGPGYLSGVGGGIYISNSIGIFNYVEIEGNVAGNGDESPGLGGGIYCNNSILQLFDVSIANNVAETGYWPYTYPSSGGGIYCIDFDSSTIYLSNVSIFDNHAFFGGGISSGTKTTINFDPVNRSNIYNNIADSIGSDLYTVGDSIISVVVDTFTVLNPDSFYAYPINKFTFDIWHDTLGTVNTIGEINNIPTQFSLKQNYPNPFNPSTKIKYILPKSENVKIEIFSLLGQKIETLLNQHMPAGSHEVEFTASHLPSGVYLYRVEAGEFQEVKKMIMLK